MLTRDKIQEKRIVKSTAEMCQRDITVNQETGAYR